MGMYIGVGVLVGLDTLDEEALEQSLEDFDLLNQALRAAGLPEHNEPRDPKVIRRWSCRAWNWNVGMNYLTRLAAYLWDGRPLPPPATVTPEPDNEPLLDDYYFVSMGGSRNNGPSFDHLLFHYTDRGFYVPMDFEEVIYPEKPLLDQVGGMIGSSVRLKDELEVLAEAMKLPLDQDPDSRELWELAQEQEQGSGKRRRGWRRYGIESLACIQLHRAARESVQSGAAIVFNC